MTQEPSSQPDYRLPTAAKWAAPRAVADGGGGTIIAVAEIAGSPEQVFQALTTDEVERWWGHPDYYRQTDWKADFPQISDLNSIREPSERRFHQYLWGSRRVQDLSEVDT